MSAAPADLRQKPPDFRPADRRHELARVLRRKRRLRAGTVQVLGVAAAVALAFLTPQIHVGFDIPTTRATEMLIAVGAGTVAFIGIVFSLLFLVVQFATTTFTPRLSLFRDDPIVWRAFAFYTAVVVYSLTAALVIGQDETTSGIVPIVAFVAILAAIVVYRRLQMGAFKSIQLASALAQVARRAREVIDGLYVAQASVCAPIEGSGRAAAASSDAPLQEIRWPRPPGIVQLIAVPRVLRAAQRAGVEIDFKVGPGQMIAEGSTIATVVGGHTEPELERAVLKALAVGEERTFEQDPAFAFRLLADIALRALSPAINDPATAVQALDTMDGLLRMLVARDLSVEHVRDTDGIIRVELVLPSWEDYLAVALDEIIALPGLSPSVARRILRLLDELSAISPPDRRPALEARRRLLSAVA